MATYYVRKDRALDGSEGPPDASGLFYWFDGSDAAASDPNAVWTDETNTDDSVVTTVGSTTTTGDDSSNYVMIEGTNAPASGATISSVDCYHFLNVAPSNFGLRIWTDGQGESLFNSLDGSPNAGLWDPHGVSSTLSTPTGGWTWAKLQALEVRFWLQTGSSVEVAAIGLVVHTTTEGESTADPFRTIDDAANAVAAGDTVYVGAGTYRETVTMDTSGSLASEIKFIADVDGSQTGDAGLVVISAFTDSNTVTRGSCWDPDGRTFIEVYDFVMQGGTNAVVLSLNTSNDNYEGCIFDGCVFWSGPDNADTCFWIDMNAATTPTNNGLTLRDCAFVGPGVRIVVDGHASADQNMKATIDNCLFVTRGSNSSNYAPVVVQEGTSNTFALGGVDVTNCTMVGCYYGVYVLDGISTTYPVTVTNCTIDAYQNALIKGTSNDGALVSDYNTHVGPLLNVTAGANDRQETSTWLLGGIADLPLYRKWGWSPYKPWEPMRPNGDDDWTSLIGDADASVAPATDLYGNPRPMSQRPSEITEVVYFDGSDNIVDNNSVWTNDSNAANRDTLSQATTSTPGATNWLRIEGTDATAHPGSGAISLVEWDVYQGTTNFAGTHDISTDGQAESLGGVSSNTVDNNWRGYASLSAPSGGWTWAKIQALEWTGYLDAGGSSLPVGAIRLRVTYTPGNADDRGAVEGRARPEQETSTVRTGSNAFRFDGAGFHDFFVPVAAQSTTITVYAQHDSNYAGTKPSMTVSNDDIMTEVTDTQTGASGSWEQLTSGAFTPSAAGVVKVRITSSDTSDDGRAFFDDLDVA